MGATVFIVDDDRAVRAAMSLLVECCGWETRAYASAREFLDAYSPGEPGCLLLDLEMRGMSGLEAQEWLGKCEIPLPVIVVTAHDDDALALRAREAGALAVLGKPFRDDELVNWIERAVGPAR
ncbi:MAG: response regulator [Gammaproteobacteria bacterium]|nr:response regulator [Gammaproteobacteria bacterium]NIR83529.1 response regulator [Gammaproteobacteria bacterium]NIR91451.1 response regulator [Gammaproteobacteria bacterium]NIU04691.1 response regulator [Gammaproteobacteria bacterium]NIV51733.1 response regulator [Gammaproteobacteria bacterium]